MTPSEMHCCCARSLGGLVIAFCPRPGVDALAQQGEPWVVGPPVIGWLSSAQYRR